MCSPATCRTCGKATYTGCGEHVDQVLAGVPAAQRCSCDSRPAAPPAPAGEQRSWLGAFRRGGSR